MISQSFDAGRVAAAFHAYHAAWFESADSRRAALLSEAVTDDVVWRDPYNNIVGIGDLSAFIGNFVRAGNKLFVIGSFEIVHDYGRFDWVAANERDVVFARGTDITVSRSDGRFAQVMIFASLIQTERQ